MKQHTIPFTLLYAWSDEFDSDDIERVNPNKNSRKNAKVCVADIASAHFMNVHYQEPRVDFANNVYILEDQYSDEQELLFSQQESRLGMLRSRIYKNKNIDRKNILPIINYLLKKNASLLETDVNKMAPNSEVFQYVTKLANEVHDIINNSVDMDIKLKVIRNKTVVPFVTSTSLSTQTVFNRNGSLDLMFPLTPGILIGVRVFKNFECKFEYNEFTWSTNIHTKYIQNINCDLASNASSVSQLIYPFGYTEDSLFGDHSPQEGFDLRSTVRPEGYIKFNK